MRTACSTTAPSQVQSSTSPSTRPRARRRQAHAVGQNGKRRLRRRPHSVWPGRTPCRRPVQALPSLRRPATMLLPPMKRATNGLAGGECTCSGRADLLDAAFVHHHQPIRQRHSLGLVMRHHDGGDAAVRAAGCGFRAPSPGAARRPDWTAVRRAAARADGSPTRAPGRRAAADRRTARAAVARRTLRAYRRSISATRACAAAAAMRRISRPNAMLRATDRCGNSA